MLALLWMLPAAARAQEAPERIDRGRFTAVFFPGDRTLATSLLEQAARTDTFPGLPRPHERVLIEIAPDHRRFREWVGPEAPEWGAAVAFPETHRIVMQGHSSGSDAGDPQEVFRHELAHLALHESMGEFIPRWFDEGYASYSAREWQRDDALAANLALAVRGVPTFDELDEQFGAGATTARNAYALAYRAVVELAALDTTAGLSRFFDGWRTTGSMDRSLRSEYGLTLIGFESRWRSSTRRRYGALALAGDATVMGAFIMLLVIPLYIARRQRDRRRLAELIAADQVSERAHQEAVIEALLRGDEPPPSWDDPEMSGPS